MISASNSSSSLEITYQQALVRRSHELLLLGYARLGARELANLEEPDITGMLCEAMEAAIDADDAPDWASSFTVVDEQPENVDGKLGKRRPRTDVCVRCLNPRPRQRFCFEAKRLHVTAALKAYLGPDGMLALVKGHYGELSHAGMVGYVQVGTCADWTDKIKKRLMAMPADYQVIVPVTLAELGVVAADPIFCSEHLEASNGRRMQITHTLLLCT